MSNNKIKYSLSTSANSLRTGNFSVGMDDNVDYGPSSSSGFYMGFDVLPNQYIIYTYDTDYDTLYGIPIRPYVAVNDQAAIDYLSTLRDFEMSTIEEALQWAAETDTCAVFNTNFYSFNTDGLVLNLDGSSFASLPKENRKWYDISNTQVNPILFNGVTYVESINGINFDGTGKGTVAMPTASGATALSYELWFRGTGSGSAAYILFNNGTNGSSTDSYLSIGVNGGNNEYYAALNGQIGPMGTGVQADSSTLHHIVLTWDGTNQRVYFDGELKATEALSPGFTNVTNYSDTLSIGDSLGAINNTFEGDIYSIRGWSTALSGDDVTELFTNGVGSYNLLDILPGSLGAYSVRDISSSYTGPLMTVRRTPDDDEAAFYPDANGVISMSSLNEHGETLQDWINVSAASDTKVGDYGTGSLAAYSLRSITDVSPRETGNNLPASFDGINGAYSLRYVNDDYTGNVIGVRRSSDDAERSFTPNELLDGSLLDWVNENVVNYTSDFTSTVDSFTGGNTGPNATREASVSDGVTTKNNVLKTYATGVNQLQNLVRNTGLAEGGCRFDIEFEYYIPSANTNVDGIGLSNDVDWDATPAMIGATTTGSWQTARYSGLQVTGNRLVIRLYDGNTSNFAGAGVSTDDIIYVTNISVTQVTANGHVHTIHDQSGNGYDLLQTTDASQPLIVETGDLITFGHKPAVKFDGSSTYLDAADASTIGYSDVSIFTVFSNDSVSGDQSVFSTNNGDGTQWTRIRTGEWFPFLNDGTTSYSITNDFYNATRRYLLSQTYGDQWKMWANGRLLDTVSITKRDLGTGSYTLGRLYNGSDYLNGTWQELIIYHEDQTANIELIENNIDSYYDLAYFWNREDVIRVRRSSDDQERSFAPTEITDGTLLSWVNDSTNLKPGDFGPGAKVAYSLRHVISDRPGSQALPADYGSGAKAAYSLRKVNSDWVGPVITVRRDSDNSTKDFTAAEIANGDVLEWVNSVDGLPGDYDGLTAAYSLRHVKNPVDISPLPADLSGGADIAYSLRNISSASTLPGDFKSGAATSLSLRYVNENYTGPVVNIRRTSDDAQADFTPTEIEDGTLLSWVNSDVDIYSSDFSSVTQASTSTGVTLTAGVTQASVDDTLKMVVTDNTFGGKNWIRFSVAPADGNLITISFDYYIPSTNSVVDGVALELTGDTPIAAGSTLDAWDSAEATLTNSTAQALFIKMTDGGSSSIVNAQDDEAYFKNVLVTQLTANGAVSVLYDQSGTSNNAEQSTDSKQPLLVNTGNIIRTNGKPAIKFDGVDDELAIDGLAGTSNQDTYFVMDYEGDVDAMSMYDLYTNANNRYSYYVDSSDGGSPTNSYGSPVLYVNGTEQLNITSRRLAYESLSNGETQLIRSDIQANPNNWVDHAFGFWFTGFGYSGTLQEWIIYQNDDGTNRRRIESNMSTYYDIDYAYTDNPVVRVFRNSDDEERDFTSTQITNGELLSWVNFDKIQYESDFTSGTDSWGIGAGLSSLTGNIDWEGITDTLRLTTDGTTGQHYASISSPYISNEGLTFDVSFDAYIDSTTSSVTGAVQIWTGFSAEGIIGTDTTDEWVTVSGTIVNDSGGGSLRIQLKETLAGSISYTPTAGENVYIKNILVTQKNANGTISVLYDQSKEGWNAVQTTESEQPKIVSIGELVTSNGKPSILFDGVDDNLEVIRPTSGTDLYTSAVISSNEAPNTSTQKIWGSSSTALYQQLRSFDVETRITSGTAVTIDDSFNYVEDQIYLITASNSNDDGYHYINTAIGDNSPIDSSTSGGYNETQFNIGNGVTGDEFNGTISELIFFFRDASNDRNSIEGNISNYYNIPYSWNGNDVVRVRRSGDGSEESFNPTEIVDGTLLNWITHDLVVYESDFSSTVDGFSDTGGTSTHGTTTYGVIDTLEFIADSSTGVHGIANSSLYESIGEDVKIECDIYLPTTNNVIDNVRIWSGTLGDGAEVVAAADVWQHVEFTLTANSGSGLLFWGLDGASNSFGGAVNDTFSVKNITITQLSSEGYVRTLFDQSGNGYHSNQTVTGRQPQISTISAVITDGNAGKPAIQFDGIADIMINHDLNGNVSVNPLTVLQVGSGSPTLSLNLNSSTIDKYLLYESGGEFRSRYNQATLNTIAVADANPHLFFHYYDGSDFYAYMDNVLGYTSAESPASNIFRINIGARDIGSLHGEGKHQEILIFNSDLSSDREYMQSAVNRYYEIYNESDPSGFVTAMYDQTGNGWDALQSTESLQPKIVDTGSLVTNSVTGLIGISGDSTDDKLVVPDLLTDLSNSDLSMFVVAENHALGQISATPRLYAQRTIFSYDTLSTISWSASTSDIQTTYIVDGATQQAWQNGESKGTASQSQVTFTETDFNIGQAGSSYTLTGFQELVIYDTTEENNRIEIESNMANYWNSPGQYDGEKVVRIRRTSDDAESDFTPAEVSDGTLLNWVNTDLQVFASDFSGGVDGYANSYGDFLTAPETEPITGETNTLRWRSGTGTGFHGFLRAGLYNTDGGTVRVQCRMYIPSTNSLVDRVRVWTGSSGDGLEFVTTLDEWVDVDTTFLANSSSNNFFWAQDGGTFNFTGNGTDLFYLKDVVITYTTATGRVTKLYDQTRSGYHLTQSTDSNQPKIVDGGTLVTQNSKPAISFDGTNTVLINTDATLANDLTAGEFSTFSVQETNDFNASADRLAYSAVTNNPLKIQILDYRSSEVRGAWYDGSSYIAQEVNPTANDTQYLTSLIYDGNGTVSLRQNDTNGVSGSNPAANSNVGLSVGASTGSSFYWDGTIQELVFYTSDQSAVQDQIESTINRYYDTYAADEPDGFVTVLYDQSRNGYHLYQETDTEQPKIVNTGVLVTENNKPAISFDGINDNLSLDRDLSLSTAQSLIGVTTSEYGDLIWRQGATNYWGNTSSQVFRVRLGDFDTNWVNGDGMPAIGGLQTIIGSYRTATNTTLTINGNSLGQKTSGTGTTALFNGLGGSSGSLHLEGTVQEFVVYDENRINDRESIEANQNYYYSVYTNNIDGHVAAWYSQAGNTDIYSSDFTTTDDWAATDGVSIQGGTIGTGDGDLVLEVKCDDTLGLHQTGRTITSAGYIIGEAKVYIPSNNTSVTRAVFITSGSTPVSSYIDTLDEWVTVKIFSASASSITLCLLDDVSGPVTSWTGTEGDLVFLKDVVLESNLAAYQDTASEQPKIITAGVLNTEGGNPTITLDTLEHFDTELDLEDVIDTYITGVSTVNSLLSGSARQPIWSIDPLQSWIRYREDTVGNIEFRIGNASNVYDASISVSGETFPLQAITTIINENNSMKGYIADLESGSVNTTTFTGFSNAKIKLGYRPTGGYLQGSIQEQIFWSGSNGASKDVIDGNLSKFYSL